jgi:hypothetical protein
VQLAFPRSRFEESAGSRCGVKAPTESIQDTSPRIHSESRLRTGEIKNLYPMKLTPRIYPWGQCFNSLI